MLLPPPETINPAVAGAGAVWIAEGGGEGLRVSNRNEASYFVGFGPHPDDGLPRRQVSLPGGPNAQQDQRQTPWVSPQQTTHSRA